MSGWCTIESDPGVFSELMQQIGVKGVLCEEVYSLEDTSLLESIKPVYGLIFLFKWKDKAQDNSEEFPQVYFAQQKISNACATQALINILLNCTDKVDIGGTLKSFLEFTQGLDAETRGIAIGNSEEIRQAHNAFARHQNFTFEEKIAKDDDDVYHFIAYIPKDGCVFELDGLKKGPVLVGEYAADNWLEIANSAIQQRISGYKTGEIHFNLLALCNDPLPAMQEELKNLSPDDEAKRLVLKERMAKIETRWQQWKSENRRRRHNYIPFIVSLLQLLSERGDLSGLIEKAKEKTKEDKEKKEERKKEKKASQA
eukprot:TRINITY_DN67210_c8_g9_i1.p2 TRINITY_DN67210_c8_g9~~TRINITY_DN67210_c8_g9_i1.p2  ORF type:complete len:313 (-),score=44.09 TRINITY_DN67210_c8_g9_i1:1028-1966(-)